VTFELLFRKPGQADRVVVSWQHHFDAQDGYSMAEPFEATATGAALDVDRGDQLVLRYTGQSASLPMAYVPNGDGARTKGRIPFVDLPR